MGRSNKNNATLNAKNDYILLLIKIQYMFGYKKKNFSNLHFFMSSKYLAYFIYAKFMEITVAGSGDALTFLPQFLLEKKLN